MSGSLQESVMRLILRDIAAVQREIEAYPDDETPWKLADGISNSGSTLAVHLAGNLHHFIGAVLGKNGYVRNRDEEFATRGASRASIVAKLRDAEAAVRTTLSKLPDSELDKLYPLTIAEVRVPTAIFLMHLATHLSYHLGQIDYHRRIITGSTTTVGTVSIPPLVAPLQVR